MRLLLQEDGRSAATKVGQACKKIELRQLTTIERTGRMVVSNNGHQHEGPN